MNILNTFHCEGLDKNALSEAIKFCDYDLQNDADRKSNPRIFHYFDNRIDVLLYKRI